MTTTEPTTHHALPTAGDDRVTPIRRVRQLLTFDAATCLATGLVALAAAPARHDDLGLATRTPMVLVGAFLVAYASLLAVAGRAEARRARLGAAVTAAGDAAWVLATIGLVVAGTFRGLGNAVAVAVGLVVAVIGTEKALALR